MKSWDNTQKKEIETPTNVVEFFNELEILCKKYDVSISHEDIHGAFIIEDYDEAYIDWMKNSILNITKNK